MIKVLYQGREVGSCSIDEQLKENIAEIKLLPGEQSTIIHGNNQIIASVCGEVIEKSEDGQILKFKLFSVSLIPL